MLVTLLSACILCAMAQALMPDGAVQQVGKLVCGLVLLCIILNWVHQLQPDKLPFMSEERIGAERGREELEQWVAEGWNEVITQRYEAYIVDKARELGIVCSARVFCRMDAEGVILPDCVVVTGEMEEDERDRLRRILEEELAVRVIYAQEGEP